MHFQVIYCRSPVLFCSAKKLQTSLIHIKDAGEIAEKSSPVQRTWLFSTAPCELGTAQYCNLEVVQGEQAEATTR